MVPAPANVTVAIIVVAIIVVVHFILHDGTADNARKNPPWVLVIISIVVMTTVASAAFAAISVLLAVVTSVDLDVLQQDVIAIGHIASDDGLQWDSNPGRCGAGGCCTQG